MALAQAVRVVMAVWYTDEGGAVVCTHCLCVAYVVYNRRLVAVALGCCVSHLSLGRFEQFLACRNNAAFRVGSPLS